MMTFSPSDPFTGGRGAALKVDPLLTLEGKLERAVAKQKAAFLVLSKLEHESVRLIGKAYPPAGPAREAYDALENDSDDATKAVWDVCREAFGVAPATMAGARAKLRLAMYFLTQGALDNHDQIDWEALEVDGALALKALMEFEQMAGGERIAD